MFNKETISNETQYIGKMQLARTLGKVDFFVILKLLLCILTIIFLSHQWQRYLPRVGQFHTILYSQLYCNCSCNLPQVGQYDLKVGHQKISETKFISFTRPWAPFCPLLGVPRGPGHPPAPFFVAPMATYSIFRYKINK